jgi:RNA polymerase sigma-70 factor, ECF subfamily
LKNLRAVRMLPQASHPPESHTNQKGGISEEKIAQEDVLAAYEPSLYALCHKILGHTEDAEDAVQETFLRALRALPKFRDEAEVRTWLFRIAINICLNGKRRQRWTVPMNAVPESKTLIPSPETATLNRARIDQALDTLSPRLRTVFLLREWQGWSIPEIAGALRCTHRRINNDLYQARRALETWVLCNTEEGDHV